MFGVTGLVFPLCLLKDISKMRIPSLLGVMALVYSIIVIIIESFFYLINENLEKNANDMNILSYTTGCKSDKPHCINQIIPETMCQALMLLNKWDYRE